MNRRTVAGLAVGAALAVTAVIVPSSLSPVGAATGTPTPVPTVAAPGPRPAPVVRRAVPTCRKPSVAVPRGSGTGRRIVYSEKVPQHVWLIDAKGCVVRDFKASGRKDWPRPGVYHVFSKSPTSSSGVYGVRFKWMVRFAHGRAASIGFHTIPTYPNGRYTHPVSQLGLAVGHGGCVHSTNADALFLYRWAPVGTTVVVLR
ncbi:MAG: L,D-transpeptidase family protein [Candidatus Nanopelagicales bacterium]